MVRVRIEIKRGDRVVETAAVASSGYEAEVPELHLPLALARQLEVPLAQLIELIPTQKIDCRNFINIAWAWTSINTSAANDHESWKSPLIDEKSMEFLRRGRGARFKVGEAFLREAAGSWRFSGLIRASFNIKCGAL